MGGVKVREPRLEELCLECALDIIGCLWEGEGAGALL